MIIDSAWAAKYNFADGLEIISKQTLHDPRGNSYETRTLVAPSITVNDNQINNPPALILPGKNPVGMKINYFGNDLLKRFNLIIDFQNDQVYLKPNGLFNTVFYNKTQTTKTPG